MKGSIIFALILFICSTTAAAQNFAAPRTTTATAASRRDIPAGRTAGTSGNESLRPGSAGVRSLGRHPRLEQQATAFVREILSLRATLGYTDEYGLSITNFVIYESADDFKGAPGLPKNFYLHKEFIEKHSDFLGNPNNKTIYVNARQKNGLLQAYLNGDERSRKDTILVAITAVEHEIEHFRQGINTHQIGAFQRQKVVLVELQPRFKDKKRYAKYLEHIQLGVEGGFGH